MEMEYEDCELFLNSEVILVSHIRMLLMKLVIVSLKK